MKILLFTCVLCITLHFSVQNERYVQKRKAYPKKVDRNIKIINARKYGRESNAGLDSSLLRNNYFSLPSNHYPLPSSRRPPAPLNVPDSPYFPIEQDFYQKPRFKKLLPAHGSRHKRSAHSPTKEKDKKAAVKEQPKEQVAKKDDAAKKPVTDLERKATRRSKGGKRTKQTKGKKSKRSKNKRSRSKKRPTLRQKKKQKRSGNKAYKPKVKRRLIAARDAKIEDYPYTVSIQKSDEHWCSGALLHNRLVITTANCVWKFVSKTMSLIQTYNYTTCLTRETIPAFAKSSQLSRMKVRAGSRYPFKGGQLAEIQEVMKHPFWNIRRDPDNDVALLLLDRYLRFSDSCHAADLPNRAMSPVFEDAWVTSWGAERRDGIYDMQLITLQVHHVRLMKLEICRNITERYGVQVTRNFLCFRQTGKRAPCTRDTGAPAVSDGVIWGLASWGIRKLCGTERFPAMYSYLASQSNINFIRNATRFIMSEKRFYPFLDGRPKPQQLKEEKEAKPTGPTKPP